MIEAAMWALGIGLFLLSVRSAVRHARHVAEESQRYSGRVYRDYDEWSGQ